MYDYHLIKKIKKEFLYNAITMRAVCFTILFISALCANATNYYVSAEKGHSGNSGLTPRKPKNVIQDAANLTKPGDTVFVMNGTYTNECPTCNVVDVPNSGAPDNYIIYTNYANHKPKISFNSWIGFSIKNGTSYVKVSGFEIVGNNANVNLRKALKQPKGCKNRGGEFDPLFNGTGISIGGFDGKYSHHVVISNNIVRDCGGGGIGAMRADYIIIEDNLVYNNSWYTVFGASGIAFYQFYNHDLAKGYHNIIRRNKCYNNRNYVPWMELCRINDGNGIIIDDFKNEQLDSKLGPYKGRTLIENNVCWYNGGTGIHTFLSDHVDIVNNTAYCNSQSKELNSGQILANAGDDIKIVNNILVSDGDNIITSNYSNKNFTYSNNLHYNITYPDKMDAKKVGKDNINGVNPRFVLSNNTLKADFNLQNRSPAIDAGSLELFSQEDFLNNDRRFGRADLGAYEAIRSQSHEQLAVNGKRSTFSCFVDVATLLWFILLPIV